MTIDILTMIIFVFMVFAIIISSILALMYFKKYNELEERMNRFMTGKNAESLEDIYAQLNEDVKYLLKEHVKDSERLKATMAQARSAFQKVGLVRYNAYNSSGGERSWVLTLLNYNNSGIIINCITGNEMSVLYIRPVKEGKSIFKLSSEEIKSLDKAIGQ